jgi:hypothetical protein
MTVTQVGHTRGSAPFPLRVRDLVLEFKKEIKLDPASFAVLKDNKQWDSVHPTLKAQTACYQDFDDVLDLSYVSSTAEDIALFKEKQKFMYSSVQASCRKKSSLIDQGADGGIAGIDTRVVERHYHRTVDICGIDNHEITTSIPIVTAGAVARSQRGDVILIMHQYAYHLQQERLIHYPCQLESLANDGNDKLIHIPGETVDCHVFPLSIRDGLPYLGMRPYMDVEYESPPHVILTSDIDWNPRLLDFDIDDNDDCWYDASSDNMNHSELFDAFRNYTGRTTELEVSSANTWFDTVNPDQYTSVQSEEATTIVCSEHAYHVHHFDNDDFDAVLLVNYTELVDTTGPVTEDDDAHSDQDMSNTGPDIDDDDNADARSRLFKVQDLDYDKFCLLSGWMNTKTTKKILEQTSTQYARMPNGTILKKHYKSTFPALNLQRCDERVTRDTVYSDASDIDGSETCAQIFVGTETLLTDVYGMKTEKEFVNTHLEDNICERGALSRLLCNRAQVEISVCVVGIFYALHIGQWQISEPHQQHQNPCERRYQTLKAMMHTILDRSGSHPRSTWLLCLLYFAVLLKLTYN